MSLLCLENTDSVSKYVEEGGRCFRLTNIEASELGVGAFGLVVMRRHWWKRAACFIDFCHCVCLELEGILDGWTVNQRGNPSIICR